MATLVAGAILLAVVAVLLCLMPKPENDLFFELRIGADILRTHHLPHFDTYSWTNRGTRWDVPEWLSFVVFAAAFRSGGFFGVWLVMAVSTISTAVVVWVWLARRISAVWAFQIVNLMLLAMSDYLQERPYTFTYLFLTVSLVVLMRAREGRPKLLLWLPPICVAWTNFHQGVLVLACLLATYAAADAITAAMRGVDGSAEGWRSARRMLATAAACAVAATASPYGWRVYWNVYITLRDRTMMSNVTEWNSIAVVPFAQLEAFILLLTITIAAIAVSRRRSLGDIVALGALFTESILHARNIALFAVGAAVIGAPYYAAGWESIRGFLGGRASLMRSVAIGFVGVLYFLTLAAVSVASLRPAMGARGDTPEGVGEAAAREPSYPDAACAFVQAERFPPNLRLFNNFSIGGYLMWRLPNEPVFVDGRLDVYTGRTFDQMLIIDHREGTPAWIDVVRQYDLDCVITTNRHISDAFARQPDWAVVYVDPKRPHHMRCVILLRRRPRFAQLIARCRRDQGL